MGAMLSVAGSTVETLEGWGAYLLGGVVVRKFGGDLNPEGHLLSGHCDSDLAVANGGLNLGVLELLLQVLGDRGELLSLLDGVGNLAKVWRAGRWASEDSVRALHRGDGVQAGWEGGTDRTGGTGEMEKDVSVEGRTAEGVEEILGLFVGHHGDAGGEGGCRAERGCCGGRGGAGGERDGGDKRGGIHCAVGGGVRILCAGGGGGGGSSDARARAPARDQGWV